MKVAELVCKTDMIIWDEAPMIHRQAFEVVDRTLRDLMQLDDTGNREDLWWENRGPWWAIFDKSCLLFPREDEKTLFSVSLLRSHFWQHVMIFCLHINMQVMIANSEE